MDVSIIAGGGGALQLNVPKVTCVGFMVNSVHMRRTDFEQVLGITRRFQSMIYFLRYFIRSEHTYPHSVLRHLFNRQQCRTFFIHAHTYLH